MRVPGHVYEDTALIVAGRFGNQAAVKFTFMPVQFESGAKVVCFGPSVQGGDSASDDGNWFSVTVAIPFDFYFIA
jgi:hypothetical protein